MIALKIKSLLAGWITIVFGTSTLIYLFSSIPSKTYYSNKLVNALRNIWEIADEMGPAVKLSIVFGFGMLVFVFNKAVNSRASFFYLANICFAIVSVLSVLAFLPADFSRGYGIGLTGTRFDAAIMPIYLLGAALGGIAFAYVDTKLLKNK